MFAGGVYTVGEAGRELFLPGVSGLIVPHGQTEQMLKRGPGGRGRRQHLCDEHERETGRPGGRRLGVPKARAARGQEGEPMAQFLNPTSDLHVGAWRTHTAASTNLWDTIADATPDEADYIQSETSAQQLAVCVRPGER